MRDHASEKNRQCKCPYNMAPQKKSGTPKSRLVFRASEAGERRASRTHRRLSAALSDFFFAFVTFAVVIFATHATFFDALAFAPFFRAAISTGNGALLPILRRNLRGARARDDARDDDAVTRGDEATRDGAREETARRVPDIRSARDARGVVTRRGPSLKTSAKNICTRRVIIRDSWHVSPPL